MRFLWIAALFLSFNAQALTATNTVLGEKETGEIRRHLENQCSISWTEGLFKLWFTDYNKQYEEFNVYAEALLKRNKPEELNALIDLQAFKIKCEHGSDEKFKKLADDMMIRAVSQLVSSSKLPNIFNLSKKSSRERGDVYDLTNEFDFMAKMYSNKFEFIVELVNQYADQVGDGNAIRLRNILKKDSAYLDYTHPNIRNSKVKGAWRALYILSDLYIYSDSTVEQIKEARSAVASENDVSAILLQLSQLIYNRNYGFTLQKLFTDFPKEIELLNKFAPKEFAELIAKRLAKEFNLPSLDTSRWSMSAQTAFSNFRNTYASSVSGAGGSGGSETINKLFSQWERENLQSQIRSLNSSAAITSFQSFRTGIVKEIKTPRRAAFDQLQIDIRSYLKFCDETKNYNLTAVREACLKETAIIFENLAEVSKTDRDIKYLLESLITAFGKGEFGMKAIVTNDFSVRTQAQIKLLLSGFKRRMIKLSDTFERRSGVKASLTLRELLDQAAVTKMRADADIILERRKGQAEEKVKVFAYDSPEYLQALDVKSFDFDGPVVKLKNTIEVEGQNVRYVVLKEDADTSVRPLGRYLRNDGELIFLYERQYLNGQESVLTISSDELIKIMHFTATLSVLKAEDISYLNLRRDHEIKIPAKLVDVNQGKVGSDIVAAWDWLILASAINGEEITVTVPKVDESKAILKFRMEPSQGLNNLLEQCLSVRAACSVGLDNINSSGYNAKAKRDKLIFSDRAQPKRGLIDIAIVPKD